MNAADLSKFIEDTSDGPNADGWWSGVCPTGKHENPKRGEFGWKVGDTSVLVNCFKRCEPGEIIEALGIPKGGYGSGLLGSWGGQRLSMGG